VRRGTLLIAFARTRHDRGGRVTRFGENEDQPVPCESLAVLAATLATPEHARWLLIAALVLAALGLGLYLFVISRFDFHQLAVGRGRPDAGTPAPTTEERRRIPAR
jgi:hypothetical protein